MEPEVVGCHAVHLHLMLVTLAVKRSLWVALWEETFRKLSGLADVPLQLLCSVYFVYYDKFQEFFGFQTKEGECFVLRRIISSKVGLFETISLKYV